MTTQSTIDRIDDALEAFERMKDLVTLGNADRPDSDDVMLAWREARIAARGLNAFAYEYDATDACLVRAVDNMGWSQAALNADERLERVRR